MINLSESLEDGLRTLLLKQYGFERAINGEDISDEDLELIKQACADQRIQTKIAHIQIKRRDDELQAALESYPHFKHPNSFSSGMLSKIYHDRLIAALPTADDQLKKMIQKVLE